MASIHDDRIIARNASIAIEVLNSYKVGSLMLSSLGYEVVTRTSSLEALEFFRSQPGYFDLAILDMAMPKMTGLNLAREMIRLRSEIPVLLCTGYSDLVDAEKAKALGIRELLIKPLKRGQLAKAVKEAMATKR